MFIRISLIVAIVAALAIAGLNVARFKHQIIHLAADRDREKALKETAERSLADTTLKLASTAKELNATKLERDQATARADSEAQRAVALTAALKAAQEERDNAMNELATWRTAPISVTDARDTVGSLKKVAEERDALRVKLYRTRARLARYESDGIELPRDLKGKVNVSDPKYGFVILDVGDDQGVFEGARLLVQRDGRLVAKVSIKTTEPNRSIANVLSGWQVAEIREGDQILVQ